MGCKEFRKVNAYVPLNNATRTTADRRFVPGKGGENVVNSDVTALVIDGDARTNVLLLGRVEELSRVLVALEEGRVVPGEQDDLFGWDVVIAKSMVGVVSDRLSPHD